MVGVKILSNAMAEVIKENGGCVNLKSEVTSINYTNNKVNEITLKNGKKFTSKYIVSNINPINTFSMIEQYNIPKNYKNKINSSTIGCSLSQLYIGLNCNPSKFNIIEEEIFYFDEYSAEENYNLSINGDYKKCGFLLTNYNNMDENLNDKDKGVLTITIIDNYDLWSNDKEIYKDQKTELTTILIDRLEKKFKGIKNHIEVLELGTPKTMQRYTNNYKGAVYGYSQNIKQAGRHRLGQTTPIDNLFLVGAWVNPGGGYEGCISSGMIAAQKIDKIIKRSKKSVSINE